MARSQLNEIAIDANTDEGSILWSIVQGEQLEFPVTLNFLTNAYGYTYEAVVMEAENVSGDDTVPTTPMPSGVNTTLTVRVPPEMGTWNSGTTYAREDVVEYPASSGLYFKSKASGNLNHATNLTQYWDSYVPNKVYIQFPEKLTQTSVSPAWAAWSVQPTFKSSVYGFFELRVTEPGGGIYQRTWKPMRGLVEVLYSPTAIV
jgi:hypothetical protein